MAQFNDDDPLDIVILNSYVSLPKGIPPRNGFEIIILAVNHFRKKWVPILQGSKKNVDFAIKQTWGFHQQIWKNDGTNTDDWIDFYDH